MKKFLCAVGVILCLCSNSLCIPAFADDSISLEAVSIRGEGTKLSPYLITEESHLVGIANGDTDESAYYRLENNIKLRSYDWKPIDFSGTFDGNGHTISNVKIGDRGSNYSNLGLFGENSGTITNLTVQAEIVTASENTGCLVGYNTGNIDNCMTMGTITASNSNGNVGGIVGENYAYYGKGKISNSYSECFISGEARYVGGIVGTCQNNVLTNCGFYGKLSDLIAVNAGGIVGWLGGYGSAEIKDCYNNSEINMSNSIYDSSSVGGIIGYADNSNFTIQNCYNKSVIESGSKLTGGLIGEVGQINISINNCYNLGDINAASDYVGGLIACFHYDSSLKMENCYSKGNIINENADCAAGIIGRIVSYGYNNFDAEIKNCAVFAEVKGNTAEAIIGSNGDVDNFINVFYNKDLADDSKKFGYGFTTNELKDKDTYLYWDFDDTWDIDKNYNDGYPYLKALGINTSGVELNKASLNMIEGDTYNLAANITPSNASNKKIMWISDDKTVVSVDDNGTVTAIGEGTAQIKAVTKDGGYTAKCDIIVKDKDYLEKTLTLSAENVVGVPGKVVKVPVSIKNNSGISSFGIDIIYDNKYLTPVEVTDGELFKVSLKNLNYSDNIIRVTYAGMSNTSGDGVLFYIVFNVKENIENTNCEIEIKPDQIKDANGINIEYLTQIGNIQIKNIILGDVDGDGEVTAADATKILRNYAALEEFNELQKSSGDVDNDGEVTAADATQVLFKYAGYDVEW